MLELVNPRDHPDYSIAEQLDHNRKVFLDSLIASGEIDVNYLEDRSNVDLLAAFYMSPHTGRDSLIHILIGDSSGGLHHSRTVQSASAPDRSVASSVELPDTSFSQLRQRVLCNGVYVSETVQVPNKRGIMARKRGHSTMFPDGWRTQDILDAAKRTLLEGTFRIVSGRRPDEQKYIAEYLVDDVLIKLVLIEVYQPGSGRDLKIITMHTEYRESNNG